MDELNMKTIDKKTASRVSGGERLFQVLEKRELTGIIPETMPHSWDCVGPMDMNSPNCNACNCNCYGGPACGACRK